MNQSQRKVVAAAALVIAAVLFVVYFAHPFWSWATWNAKEGTLDFGIMKITNRPPFPSDGRAIGLGLVLPVVLGAIGRVIGLSGADGDGE
jgi:hypothetical protein